MAVLMLELRTAQKFDFPRQAQDKHHMIDVDR